MEGEDWSAGLRGWVGRALGELALCEFVCVLCGMRPRWGVSCVCCQGGAVYAGGDITITSSSFSGNSAVREGCGSMGSV